MPPLIWMFVCLFLFFWGVGGVILFSSTYVQYENQICILSRKNKYIFGDMDVVFNSHKLVWRFSETMATLIGKLSGQYMVHWKHILKPSSTHHKLNRTFSKSVAKFTMYYRKWNSPIKTKTSNQKDYFCFIKCKESYIKMDFQLFI